MGNIRLNILFCRRRRLAYAYNSNTEIYSLAHDENYNLTEKHKNVI